MAPLFVLLPPLGYLMVGILEIPENQYVVVANVCEEFGCWSHSLGP